MKKLALLLLLSSPSWAYSFYRSVTIDHTQCGSVDNVNFPVLVSIVTQTYIKTAGNGGNVQNSSGFDIGFFSDVNLTTKLDWEVEFYDGTAGTLKAWVRIPTLSHTSDVVFYMGYGDGTISTFQGNVAGTWDSANGTFVGVWHFPNGSSLTTADSTSNANNGTNNGATATTLQIDGAAAFVGASTQYVDMGNAASLNLGGTDQTRALTLDAWISFASYTAGEKAIADKLSGASGILAGYYLGLTDTGSAFKLFFFMGENSGVPHTQSSDSTIAPGTYHVVVTYGPANIDAFMRMYINGVAQTPVGASVGPGQPTTNFNAGRWAESNGSSTPSRYFTGTIDELRLNNVRHDSNWVTAEYNNEKTGSTFITIGGAVTNTVPGQFPRVQ